LGDYIDMKLVQLRQQVRAFESKWGMTFAEFSERCAANTLGQDPYAYDVESDFWEWEKAVTLLQHKVPGERLQVKGSRLKVPG